MKQDESQNVEYKRSWHDVYLKWVCGFDRNRSECEKEGVQPPTVAEKDGYVRLTFARTAQLGWDSVRLNSESCTENREVDKNTGQEEVGKKRAAKVSQKREKVSQKRTAEVGQKSAMSDMKLAKIRPQSWPQSWPQSMDNKILSLLFFGG